MLRGPRVSTEQLNADFAAWGQQPSFRGVPKPGAKSPRKLQPELALATQVARTLSYAIAPPGRCSSFDTFWFAIEQAGGKKPGAVNPKTGKRYDLNGQRNRAKGVRSGVPDLFFIWPQGHGWIELKAGKNDTSDNQDDMHRELRKAGDLVATCWSHDEVMLTLRKWGVPLRAA